MHKCTDVPLQFLDGNIQRLDLIAAELHKIKKALIQAQAARDAGGKEAA